MTQLETTEKVTVETATQKINGGRRVRASASSEVLFLDMKPANGAYEPLIGYIVLEQCQAAIDMKGHRLIPGKAIDAK